MPQAFSQEASDATARWHVHDHHRHDPCYKRALHTAYRILHQMVSGEIDSFAEEEVDYGSSPERNRSSSPMELERAVVNSLEVMPDKCEGRPFPMLLLDEEQVFCKYYGQLPSSARPYLEASNSADYAARIARHYPDDAQRKAAAAHQLRVVGVLKALPAADPDLYIGLRDFIHQHITDDQYASCRWIAAAAIAIDYSPTLDALDELTALRTILDCNLLGAHVVWPEHTNVDTVPDLSRDLLWSPRAGDSAGWVRASDIKAGNVLMQAGFDSVSPHLLLDNAIQFGSVPLSVCSSGDQVVPVSRPELTFVDDEYQLATDLGVEPRRSARQAKLPAADPPSAEQNRKAKRKAKKAAQRESPDRNEAGPSGLLPPVLVPAPAATAKGKGKAAAKAVANPRRFLWQSDSEPENRPVVSSPLQPARGLSAFAEKGPPDWLFEPVARAYSPTASLLPAPVRSRERSPVLRRPQPYRPPLLPGVSTCRPMGLGDIRRSLRRGIQSPVSRDVVPPVTAAQHTDAWVARTLPMPTPEPPLTTSPVFSGAAYPLIDVGKVNSLHQRLMLPENETLLHKVIRWFLTRQPGGAHPEELGVLTLEEIKLLHKKLLVLIRLADGAAMRAPPVQVNTQLPREGEEMQGTGLAATVNSDAPAPHTTFPFPTPTGTAPAFVNTQSQAPVRSGHEVPVNSGAVQQSASVNRSMNGLKLPLPPTFNGSARNFRQS